MYDVYLYVSKKQQPKSIYWFGDVRPFLRISVQTRVRYINKIRRSTLILYSGDRASRYNSNK
jgi:hypothetical protein